MPGLFVTATGTDVGKTYVAAGLLRAGRRASLAMTALKPILTGFDAADPGGNDAGVLLAALGVVPTTENVERMAPWRFDAPLAPSMAAAAEGRRLDVDAVIAACRSAACDRLTLIEGVGGVMVPLDESRTILDLIAALDLPVLLVTATALGALSHCLTACAALRGHGCAPALLVINESAGATVPLDATRETLAAFLPDVPAAVVPRGAQDAVFDALLGRVLTIVPSSAA